MAIPSWWIARRYAGGMGRLSALAVTTSASGAEYTLTAQKDAAAQDLIYQPQPVNAANAGAVAVEMKHAYSKLSFLATAGNGYTGAANLTQVQITGGIYATGTLDMVAGTVDPGRHGDGGAYPGRRRKGACRAYGR